MKKVIGILLIVGLLWWVLQSRDVTAPDTVPAAETSGADAMVDAPDPLAQIDELMVAEEVPEPEVTTLDAVDARGGTATATRVFADGQMMHTVRAEVGDPQEGKFYEGWLVQKPPLRFYSTGKMAEREEGVYELTYVRADDAEARYNEVVITEETLADGLDNKPEGHIFEGSF